MAARRSWLPLLFLYSVASFVESAFWGQMGAFTPLYLPALGIPHEDVPRWTGTIVAVAALTGIPFLPLWGALADRYTRRPIIIRSFVAHLLSALVAGLAGNVWVFLLGRSLMAFALGNSGLMMATLAERAPPRRLGLAFAVFNGAGPVGAFLGPLAGGPIVDRWGFPTLLFVNAGLMAGVIAVLALADHDDYRGARDAPLARMALESIALVWRSPQRRALLPALFFIFGGWMLALAYVPLAVTQLYTGADPNRAVGIVLGAGGVMPLLLAPLLGLLADRFGHWRVLRLGAAAVAVLWPLPALAPSLTGFTAAWAVVNGIASSVFAISFGVLSASAAPAERGRIMAFAFLPVNVGAVLGPALGAWITHATVFAVFPAAAGFTFIGLVLLALAAGRAPRSLPDPPEKTPTFGAPGRR